jgi:hypothetical protein
MKAVGKGEATSLPKRRRLKKGRQRIEEERT